MNQNIHKEMQHSRDVTLAHDLVLKVSIDNSGWTLEPRSSLKCVPSGAKYRYTFGNGPHINRTYRHDDTSTLNIIHEFVCESFRLMATIYTQGTATCEYTLTFRDNDVHVQFKDSLKKNVWDGILTPGAECVPSSGSPHRHPTVHEHFDVDLLSEIFEAINAERFSLATSGYDDDSSGYVM